MGKRILPTIIQHSRELVHWGETPRGYQIYREETPQGGRYWSDEIGGGVIVWHTALVSPETLETCLKMEGWIMSSEGRKAVEGLRAEILESVDASPDDGDIPITLSIGDALSHISTALLHKEVAAREGLTETIPEEKLRYPIERYEALLDHITECLAVDGEVWGNPITDERGQKYEAWGQTLTLICDALKHAAGERLAEAQICHLRRLIRQACQDIEDLATEMRRAHLGNRADKLDDIRELFEHMTDPIIGHAKDPVARYEREIFERIIAEKDAEIKAYKEMMDGSVNKEPSKGGDK